MEESSGPCLTSGFGFDLRGLGMSIRTLTGVHCPLECRENLQVDSCSIFNGYVETLRQQPYRLNHINVCNCCVVAHLHHLEVSPSSALGLTRHVSQTWYSPPIRDKRICLDGFDINALFSWPGLYAL